MSLEVEIRKVVRAELRAEVAAHVAKLEDRLRKDIKEAVRACAEDPLYKAGWAWKAADHESLNKDVQSFVRMESLKHGRTIGGIWARIRKMIQDGEFADLEREEDDE